MGGCGSRVIEGLDKWFDAARDGDVEFIKSNLKKMATESESRATNPDFGIYNGFSAIHYAIVCE